jgi:DNA polymerase
VIASPGPRDQVAGIARQARELLVKVRESRWSGFEPPSEQPTPQRASAPPRKPSAAPVRPSGLAGRPTARAPVAAAAPAATPSREETATWNSLEAIVQAVSTCTKCQLHATRTRTVPGEGNPKPRLLFVGEAPGADEDRTGRPFVGAAGQLLDKMIVAMGLARSQVFIANVLKCRPPGNRTPLPAEVASCAPYLRAQIELLGPEIICSLGNPATQALLGGTETISRLRGRFSSYRGIPVMPTFHPSYLLRSPADRKLSWQDLQQIMQRLGLPLRSPSPAQENE